MPRTREQLAERAAQELGDGFYVNLGIGIPTLVANYIPEGMTPGEKAILSMLLEKMRLRAAQWDRERGDNA